VANEEYIEPRRKITLNFFGDTGGERFLDGEQRPLGDERYLSESRDRYYGETIKYLRERRDEINSEIRQSLDLAGFSEIEQIETSFERGSILWVGGIVLGFMAGVNTIARFYEYSLKAKAYLINKIIEKHLRKANEQFQQATQITVINNNPRTYITIASAPAGFSNAAPTPVEIKLAPAEITIKNTSETKLLRWLIAINALAMIGMVGAIIFFYLLTAKRLL
jgi:hypothetical protein